MGCRAVLQGIFPTHGLNLGLLHCRHILYQLSHQGSLRKVEWVAYPFSSGSSSSGNQTGVSCIAYRFFTSWVWYNIIIGHYLWGNIRNYAGRIVARKSGYNETPTKPSPETCSWLNTLSSITTFLPTLRHKSIVCTDDLHSHFTFMPHLWCEWARAPLVNFCITPVCVLHGISVPIRLEVLVASASI